MLVEWQWYWPSWWKLWPSYAKYQCEYGGWTYYEHYFGFGAYQSRWRTSR